MVEPSADTPSAWLKTLPPARSPSSWKAPLECQVKASRCRPPSGVQVTPATRVPSPEMAFPSLRPIWNPTSSGVHGVTGTNVPSGRQCTAP